MSKHLSMIYALVAVSFLAWDTSCYAFLFHEGHVVSSIYWDSVDYKLPFKEKVQLPEGPITDEVAEQLYQQHRGFHGRPHAELKSVLKKILGLPHVGIHESLPAVIALVHAGVSPNASTFFASTLFAFIFARNYLAIADYLLRKELPHGPLHGAFGPSIFSVKTPEMLILLKKHKVDFTQCDSIARENILSHLICEKKIDIEHLLPDFAWLVNKPNKWGGTPIMQVIRMSRITSCRFVKVQALINCGAKRHYRYAQSRSNDYRMTAAQLAECKLQKDETLKQPEKDELLQIVALLNSNRAPTLAETALRTLLIQANKSDGTATTLRAQDDRELLQLPAKMPAAYTAALRRLTVQAKDDEDDEVARQQAAKNLAYLEMLCESCYMNQELIVEYDEEQRQPGVVSMSSSVDVGIMNTQK